MKTGNELDYQFLRDLGRTINAGQSRAIALTGNVLDWFFSGDGYVPLVDMLVNKWGNVRNYMIVRYQPNGPLQIHGDEKILEKAWMSLMVDTRNVRPDSAVAKKLLEQKELDFSFCLKTCNKNPGFALQFLRQLCLASRLDYDGNPMLGYSLIVVIEGADMLIPAGEISRLSEDDRRRIAICRDWFCDPGFVNGSDTVILVTESQSELNEEVRTLPQLLEIEILSPGLEERERFIKWFIENAPVKPRLWSTPRKLAEHTAALSVLAIMQMLKGFAYTQEVLEPRHVVQKVEAHIKHQLGEDVVEFHKPGHRIKDLVGFRDLKSFLKSEFIPMLKSGLYSGAAVAGPNRVGKSYIFEAVAGDLEMVVLTIKNIRSMYYGQTDVIWERLRRVLIALYKVVILVDEADTMFGGVGSETHPTERRLTGKIQNMMADPKFAGKVIWLLLTARIHLLSPDIRQPGRAGDIIIPVLDPEGRDRRDFLVWVLKAVVKKPSRKLVEELDKATEGFSPGAFASLRKEVRMKGSGKRLSGQDVVRIAENRIPADVKTDREIQTLHALLNCTHRELLPPEFRKDVKGSKESWKQRLLEIEIRR